MNDNERLKQWMQAHGYTAAKVARATGDPRSAVSMMLGGKRELNQAFRWRFKEAFGNEAADAVFCAEVRELA